MADYSAMSTGVGQLNYTFGTSTAAEFGVKIENAGTHTNGFRQTQIARIQERLRLSLILRLPGYELTFKYGHSGLTSISTRSWR